VENTSIKQVAGVLPKEIPPKKKWIALCSFSMVADSI
jgi:hypothetical protein